jgi:hypothetical protein
VKEHHERRLLYLFLLPFCLLQEILLFSFPFENESGRSSAIYGARLPRAACASVSRLHNANAAEKCDQFSIKQMLCSVQCVRRALNNCCVAAFISAVDAIY